MRLCLVEDLAACGLEPLTLTRPVHELLLGATTLASKIARALGVGPGPQRRSCLIRSHLVDSQRQRDPHMVVNDRDWLARGPVVGCQRPLGAAGRLRDARRIRALGRPV